MKIYLDDERKLPDDTWTLVRSYDEFIDLIENITEPIEAISFDHDLGVDKNDDLLPTGYDAAKWLVDKIDVDKTLLDQLEYLNVHSANPVGAENIRGYFRSAKKVGMIAGDVDIT